ncbi:dTDP-4-dehydrorhamnose reductase [Crassaminicella indica]|uniref:dTDP-4-dehydrorhamnose reductase n=1 Tax=Crassaminicella indica TaxID=2855394 RepID=A0ABX8RBB2_9CLOT|nr:dTDP-4-dehydrorhamnose reductase [Crassaminicella indica]QXM06345.1 dTDP-4-dehydrorhamnose reductase [Crassaminicella indica]
MNILITGGNGQLARCIMDIFTAKECALGKLDKIYYHTKMISTDKSSLDITCFENIKRCFTSLKPHIVINTAAYTYVDGCESNIALAYQVNALGAKNLAIACEAIKAKLIHLSTDYIFDGKSKVPYKEFDFPNPINIYGKSKYLGEEYVKQFCSRYFIIRTGWLYGYHKKNFVKTIIKTAKEKKYLEVIDDQTGNPTNAEDLAYHILKLALTDAYGIYHCTGNGECSWYDFAKEITKYANINCMIHPIHSCNYKSIAKRPAYSALDNIILKYSIGDNMRNWKVALKDFIHHLSL